MLYRFFPNVKSDVLSCSRNIFVVEAGSNQIDISLTIIWHNTPHELVDYFMFLLSEFDAGMSMLLELGIVSSSCQPSHWQPNRANCTVPYCSAHYPLSFLTTFVVCYYGQVEVSLDSVYQQPQPKLQASSAVGRWSVGANLLANGRGIVCFLTTFVLCYYGQVEVSLDLVYQQPQSKLKASGAVGCWSVGANLLADGGGRQVEPTTTWWLS